ncbi:MAG: hypothetical protein U5O16_37350 [Rhodococcus sp. (in: high G+C Gram-positive bacteria)]|uniref:hypothetical protein n=1 Tax=Rhodococcus sp. TaxID=1831 RepID=UPI002ADC9A47|nr:hypothetical protein [Rhodococcus sp. (in: high G+C Gram-positive bacteria)]
MSEHKQMVPPDYHRCLETVFSSPAACRELLERLAKTTDVEVQSQWSPWRGQQPPPYGPDVKKQVPAEVQLLMLESTYAGYRASQQRLWRELYDVMGIRPMQESTVELIWSVRVTIDRLENRIEQLERAEAEPDHDNSGA